jgi:hypothetical protein
MTNSRPSVTISQPFLHSSLAPSLTVLLAAFLFSALTSGAQSNLLARYEHLKQPQISTKPSLKVLVIEAKGDPNIIGGNVFGLLFELCFRLPQTPKPNPQGSPRARWPQGFDSPKSEWTGIYALPVPETVTNLPSFQPQPGLNPSVATWQYGTVAEILHLGPYTNEAPTLKRLADFIKAQGYVILPGGHEEEYAVGPGMRGIGDPEKYVTILRYRVRKSSEKIAPRN